MAGRARGPPPAGDGAPAAGPTSAGRLTVADSSGNCVAALELTGALFAATVFAGAFFVIAIPREPVALPRLATGLGVATFALGRCAASVFVVVTALLAGAFFVAAFLAGACFVALFAGACLVAFFAGACLVAFFAGGRFVAFFAGGCFVAAFFAGACFVAAFFVAFFAGACFVAFLAGGEAGGLALLATELAFAAFTGPALAVPVFAAPVFAALVAAVVAGARFAGAVALAGVDFAAFAGAGFVVLADEALAGACCFDADVDAAARTGTGAAGGDRRTGAGEALAFVGCADVSGLSRRGVTRRRSRPPMVARSRAIASLLKPAADSAGRSKVSAW